MKSKIILIFCILAASVQAQKEDHKWVINHVCGIPQASQLDFNTSPVTVSVIDREMCVIATNASICDEAGAMLLYTNGQEVYNKNDEILENGDSINYGYWFQNFGNNGYPSLQGAFFLQKPGSDDIYYLFHMFVDYVNSIIPQSALYSVIDVGYNNGAGRVLEKNVPLLMADASENYIQATAVRHANGRDWWIVVPSHMGPQYYRFLLSPDGIEGPWMQEIGYRQMTNDFNVNGFGQRVFSPDGSKFADYDFDNFTQVFDFDRCTGLLSNAKLIDHGIDSVLINSGGGVSFSPNGRFLYITRSENGYTLRQYDTEAQDILASGVKIAECAINTCVIANQLLAPDGRIYLSGGDSAWLYVINKPDSLGLACDFQVHGLELPLLYPNVYYPYFPNYRLGALEGSGCDTILSSTTSSNLKKLDMQLSPNPANEYTKILLQNEIPFANLSLYMATGQMAHQQRISSGWNLVPLDGLAPGLYFYEVKDEGRVLGTGKLVKVE